MIFKYPFNKVIQKNILKDIVLIVLHSNFTEEEMSCLATWKEGNRKYLVAMMNHSHVYNDESRYRCFIYQKQRGNNRGRHHVTDRTVISHKAGNQNNPGVGSPDIGVLFTKNNEETIEEGTT